MVGVAFLAQNCSLGLAYATYGPISVSLERLLGLSRTEASMGVGLMALTLALLSPVVGLLLERVSIRLVMLTGAVVNASAFAYLAHADRAYEIMIAYSGIGIGNCLLGIIPPIVLVGRWIDRGRGRMLGLVNMPVAITVAPLIVAPVIAQFGVKALLLGMVGIYVFLMLPLLTIVDRPGPSARPVEIDRVPARESRAFLARWEFWALTLGVGMITGVGSLFMGHIVPIALEKGIDLQSAAMLTSSYGAFAIAGNITIGWLADRLGATVVASLLSAALVAIWCAVWMNSDFHILLIVAGTLGACATSMVPLHGLAARAIFDDANVARVMGFGYFFKIPFMFGCPLFAGYQFDRSGNYFTTYLFAIGLNALAFAAFVLLAVKASRLNRRSGSRRGGVA